MKCVKWSLQHYPFGESYNEQVSTSNYIRFPGQWEDNITDLYYNWHRFYRPELGQYISPDPIGLAGGINMYSYVGGNPINYIDPWGLKKFTQAETAALLEILGEQSLQEAAYNHSGGEIYDFKVRFSSSTFNIDGTEIQADQFRNFATAYVGIIAGERFAGTIGILIGFSGVKYGGIFYDFKDARHGYGEFDYDADSYPDILSGTNYALQILKKQKKEKKCK